MGTEPEIIKSALVAGVELDGVELHILSEMIDPRGSFTEIFQKHWGSCIEPVQWSVVKSNQGVFRGMHYHNRHDEYFCLISGSCFVGLKDIKPGSPSFDNFSLFELNGNEPIAITFPRGLLHGWYFKEASVHIQAVSESYKDYNSDDNFGCMWNDPDLGIPWPFKEAKISERAKNFYNLKELTQLISGSR